MSTANRTADEHPLRRKPRTPYAETQNRSSTEAPHLTALGAQTPQALSPQNVLRLQRLAGNNAVNRVLSPTIQRLKGAPGTAQAGKPLTYEFSDDFKKKHTGENATDAKKATEARVKTGKPSAIVDGTIPNHVAKLADWKTVIDAHAAAVPPDGEWSAEDGDIEDPTWVERLAQVTVTGWEPRSVDGKVTEPGPSTFKRYVGGKWQVTGSVFDDEDNLDTPGAAHMLIDHLTQ